MKGVRADGLTQDTVGMARGAVRALEKAIASGASARRIAGRARLRLARALCDRGGDRREARRAFRRGIAGDPRALLSVRTWRLAGRLLSFRRARS
jgi:hypothetical protein